MLRLLLNILWLLLGGLEMAVAWFLVSLVLVVTIIGIPWARAAFNIAIYTLWPFGQEAVDRAAHSGQEDIGTGPLGVIGNIIWFLLFGWWLAIGHLIAAFLLALTIIGLAFSWAHLKLAVISLWPVGKTIVPKDLSSVRPQ